MILTPGGSSTNRTRPSIAPKPGSQPLESGAQNRLNPGFFGIRAWGRSSGRVLFVEVISGARIMVCVQKTRFQVVCHRSERGIPLKMFQNISRRVERSQKHQKLPTFPEILDLEDFGHLIQDEFWHRSSGRVLFVEVPSGARIIVSVQKTRF